MYCNASLVGLFWLNVSSFFYFQMAINSWRSNYTYLCDPYRLSYEPAELRVRSTEVYGMSWLKKNKSKTCKLLIAESYTFQPGL